MEKRNLNKNDYFTIDISYIIKSVIRRWWVILIVAVLSAALGFSYSTYAIAPTYSSSIMLYVNNSSFSLGNTSFSISSSEITAAQSLVNTYGEILLNRTTLERIIDKTDVPYRYEDLANMIETGSSNKTEIMKVTVTSENPYEAAKIANCIAEVLPVRISEIIDGASMEVVDSAVPVLQKVAPSVSLYTKTAFVLGFLLAACVFAVFAAADNTIRDEDYIINEYDYPVLAMIPDLEGASKKKYGYYSSSRYYASSHYYSSSHKK